MTEDKNVIDFGKLVKNIKEDQLAEVRGDLAVIEMEMLNLEMYRRGLEAQYEYYLNKYNTLMGVQEPLQYELELESQDDRIVRLEKMRNFFRGFLDGE